MRQSWLTLGVVGVVAVAASAQGPAAGKSAAEQVRLFRAHRPLLDQLLDQTLKLAEAFRTDLLVAARDGVLFDVETGLPVTLRRKAPSRTWYDHARGFASMKWPHASPRHRKGIARPSPTSRSCWCQTTGLDPRR